MLALIAFAAAAVQPASAALAGVWEGTIGNLPVRACFGERDWGPFGAYYYLSRRRLIPLDQVEGAAGTFSEGSADPGNPRWRVESAGGDRLQARWSQGRRVLPVRLTRVAVPGEDAPCAAMAFHRPRLDGVRTVTRPATTDGVAWTRIALDHGDRFDAVVETFALAGAGAPARRINQAVGQALAGDPPEWFECLRAPLQRGPHEGGFTEMRTPVMISRRWLSVNRSFDDFCGGAHPNHGLVYETWDLTTGAAVDLHDWFTPAAVRRERLEGMDEELKSLLPALRAVILAGWRGENAEECREVVRDADYWLIGLRRTAFVFAPDLPHVVQACADEFTVPFARVRPFLTREGAANLDGLR